MYTEQENKAIFLVRLAMKLRENAKPAIWINGRLR